MPENQEPNTQHDFGLRRRVSDRISLQRLKNKTNAEPETIQSKNPICCTKEETTNHSEKELVPKTEDQPEKADADYGKTKESPCYFWQYNVQSKKQKRDFPPPTPDPFGVHTALGYSLPPPEIGPEVQPVVPEDNAVATSFRRRGNDLSADPKKLYRIGQDLHRLEVSREKAASDQNNLVHKHAAQLERRKLASKVCRLKKKAQHEANKIKYQGLEKQYGELLKTLQLVRGAVLNNASTRLAGVPPRISSVVELTNNIKEENLRTIVRGRSADFVNDQIKMAETDEKVPTVVPPVCA